jgi:hypothetical protein
MHHADVFADYFQFYLCDEAYQTDTGVLWNDATTDRMLAVGPDLIAVATARNMYVPVDLEVLGSEPIIDLNDWDQVIECSITVPSGKLILIGCTDNPDKAERLEVTPGSYSARVSYARLTELSDDGLEGNDLYRVQLWPGSLSEVKVLKRRRT